jgi:outer membrane protein assembly factor BamB
VAIGSAGQVLWRVRTGGLIEVSPAVASDRTVVFGSNDSLEYRVTPRGRARWRHSINEYTYSSPGALPGDRVVFGDHLGSVNVLDARNGRVIHRYQGRGQVWTSAVVDRSGDVYFATRRGDIYGFAAAGSRRFRYRLPPTFDSYPALAGGGTLLVGADDGALLAFGTVSDELLRAPS